MKTLKEPAAGTASQSAGKNRETPVILAAAAIAAAILCGVFFLPRVFFKNEIGTLDETGSLSVGDHFYFGSYIQNTGKPEPVKWHVLAVEDGKAFVISEYPLDCARFDPSSGVWESSELRAWLNDGFMSEAFSDSEKERILLTDNEDTGTEDRVFCLSVDEAERYFGSSADRMATPTAYAIDRGAYTNGGDTLYTGLNTGWWWLRSPCSGDSLASIVNSHGNINASRVNNGEGSVRPAMWVSLRS